MNYIAYTIGPIYDTIFDTLNGDKKTKKLYAGSYFFSYFMKTLLKNIKTEFDVLVPFIDGDILDQDYKMGLFHDRFIATCKHLSKDEAKKIFENKVKDTFIALATEIQDATIADKLQNNMNNHTIIASDDELKKVDKNIIFALNKILDAKELQRTFSFDKEKNYIQQYQNNFVQNSKKKVKTLETISKDFNYYAVITADGDKMGDKIQKEATQNPENIKTLSKKLFEFFTKEKDVFTLTNNEFDGELIYAGGDDILAFIPVKYKNEDKIRIFLEYVDALDKKFKAIVGDDVSLSFGVNIVYYKYPLRNAINKSFDLLHEAKINGQNSIALNITKHSGQSFNSILKLHSDLYRSYKDIVNAVLNEGIKLPHSLHHSLKRYESSILSIYTDGRTCNALFDTIFNDEKDVKTKDGIETIKNYINTYKPTSKKEFDDIFSQLSLVKFLREDRQKEVN